MAKRGRKPSAKRKGYFYEREEQAVIDYLNSTDNTEKNRIYSEILHPAFCKLAECIINRYKLNPPDEEFNETFDDTISFMMSKINKFKPGKYKAYSYFGTVCKNYLIHKVVKSTKLRDSNIPYDTLPPESCDPYDYDTHEDTDENNIFKELIEGSIKKINKILDNKKELQLTKDEIKVGNALNYLLSNWENFFVEMGSNKFNKSSILLYLRETTCLNTNEIRNAMKLFKVGYYDMKEHIINENY